MYATRLYMRFVNRADVFLHSPYYVYTGLRFFSFVLVNKVQHSKLLKKHFPSPFTHVRFVATHYSVLVFCSGSTSDADLSGSNAATSSIFLNCHGKRDGYKKGRMSKPVCDVIPTRQQSGFPYRTRDATRQKKKEIKIDKFIQRTVIIRAIRLLTHFPREAVKSGSEKVAYERRK
jgi:hypothetical protein